MQLVDPPHDGEVGCRYSPAGSRRATADVENLRLFGDWQIVLAVDHRFALSKPLW